MRGGAGFADPTPPHSSTTHEAMCLYLSWWSELVRSTFLVLCTTTSTSSSGRRAHTSFDGATPLDRPQPPVDVAEFLGRVHRHDISVTVS